MAPNHTTSYAPVFKNGTSLFSPQVDHMVQLTISAASPNLSLKMSPMSSKAFDMMNIGSFVFEITNLENDNPAQWIMDNLQGMPSITSLTIRCLLKTTSVKQSKVKFQVLSKARYGRDERYTHVLVTDDGSECEDDYEVMRKIGNLGVKNAEIQSVMDLFMMLDRNLLNTKRFPTFPDTISTRFQWIL